MAVKYSKAPISELVLGVFFDAHALLNKGIFFELLSRLMSDFPNINTHPVFAEEDLINDIIQSSLDYSKSGFSTYRLSSLDSKWQVLLQQNVLTLHWNRQDFEDVGNYPGFAKALEKFLGIYDLLIELFNKAGIELEKNIKAYYLCYNDRILYEEYKAKNVPVSDIINIPTPFFYGKEKKYSANNYVNRYSTPCEEINGHSLILINTPTLPGVGQLLIIENKLKGGVKEEEANKSEMIAWFNIAHDMQISFFENIFKEEILKTWK